MPRLDSFSGERELGLSFGQYPVVTSPRQVPRHGSSAFIGWMDAGDEPLLVDLSVVALAQECRVGQVRGAAIGPVHDVVRLSPGCRRVASREGALTVSVPQHPTLPPREQAGHPTQVDDLTVCPEDDGNDVSITGQLPHDGRGEHGLTGSGPHDDASPAPSLGTREASEEVGERHGHVHDGGGPTRIPLRGIVCSGASEHRVQSLHPPLTCAAQVGLACLGVGGGLGKGPDRGLEPRGLFWGHRHPVFRQITVRDKRTRQEGPWAKPLLLVVKLALQAVLSQQPRSKSARLGLPPLDAIIKDGLGHGRHGLLGQKVLHPRNLAQGGQRKTHTHLARDHTPPHDPLGAGLVRERAGVRTPTGPHAVGRRRSNLLGQLSHLPRTALPQRGSMLAHPPVHGTHTAPRRSELTAVRGFGGDPHLGSRRLSLHLIGRGHQLGEIVGAERREEITDVGQPITGSMERPTQRRAGSRLLLVHRSLLQRLISTYRRPLTTVLRPRIPHPCKGTHDVRTSSAAICNHLRITLDNGTDSHFGTDPRTLFRVGSWVQSLAWGTMVRVNALARLLGLSLLQSVAARLSPRTGLAVQFALIIFGSLLPIIPLLAGAIHLADLLAYTILSMALSIAGTLIRLDTMGTSVWAPISGVRFPPVTTFYKIHYSIMVGIFSLVCGVLAVVMLVKIGPSGGWFALIPLAAALILAHGWSLADGWFVRGGRHVARIWQVVLPGYLRLMPLLFATVFGAAFYLNNEGSSPSGTAVAVGLILAMTVIDLALAVAALKIRPQGA